MSQHDYNIANGGGAAVRADINNALLAILSQNSGATAPTTTKPFMLWYDTANSLIKMRNAADNAWIDYMNSSGQLVAPTATGLITALGGQIKFPASQNASSDANTLDDYEEGTWTPTDQSGAGLSFATATGIYTKIGRLVVALGQVAWPVTANGVSAAVSLPFASANIALTNYSAGSAMNSANLHLASFVTLNSSSVSFYKMPNTSFVQATNANLSNQFIYFAVTYFTA